MHVAFFILAVGRKLSNNICIRPAYFYFRDVYGETSCQNEEIIHTENQQAQLYTVTIFLFYLRRKIKSQRNYKTLPRWIVLGNE